MDKIKKYKQFIVNLLTEYVNLPVERGVQPEEFQEQLILDEKNNHYQVLNIGWNGMNRIYLPVFHIDIIDEKIWVQEDATDFNIVEKLEALGVPKSDIVLAFHAPYKRPYTEYAIA